MVSKVPNGRGLLRPAELLVLEGVLTTAARRTRETLSAQIDAIELVQRPVAAVNFYYRPGPKGPDDFDHIPTRGTSEDELRLARVTLFDPDAGTRTEGVVWIVQGRLFCIEFDDEPPHAPAERIQIENVEILHDPHS